MAKIIVKRADMLELAIKAFDLLEEENLLAELTSLPAKEYKEVAEKMLISITKAKAKKPEGPSKTAIENEKLAHEVAMVMPEGTAVTTKWIMEHVNGITTSQKCTKVMQVLINKGRAEKVYKVDGRNIGYKLI